MGAVSFPGGPYVAGSVKKLRPRCLSAVYVTTGLCLIPCRIALLMPVSAFVRYILPLILWCA